MLAQIPFLIYVKCFWGNFFFHVFGERREMAILSGFIKGRGMNDFVKRLDGCR